MKSKTIRLTLSKKLKEWLDSIKDERVRELAKTNAIVTGGSIASMLMKEEVNDFDFYFRTQEATKAVAEYYVEQFKGLNANFTGKVQLETNGRIRIVTEKGHRGETVGNLEEFTNANEIAEAGGAVEDAYEELEKKALATQEEDKEKRYRPVFLSTNAITLANKVQIVIRFYGEPEQIHENYDYVHCTNYWTGWDNQLYLKLEALESLMAKELRYVGSKYPLCSIIRMRKFIQRGWSINAGQILKMVMQCHALNLLDPAVLEDQLTGVDSAYFLELIFKLKEKDPEKINTAYLVEIIDRIF